MVEISLSGSGEGPGWATSRPTLHHTFQARPARGARARSPCVDVDEKLGVCPADQVHHTPDPSIGEVNIEGVCAFRVVSRPPQADDI